MFNLQDAVLVVVYLLIAGAVFGLLFFLINYVSRQFPEMAPFAKFAKIILVVMIVLTMIGFLIGLISGQPLFRWGPGPGQPVRQIG